MAVTIDGTNGVSGVEGTETTPAIQGNDTNTGVFFPLADTVAVTTNGLERMRIDASGNIGIGTNSPTQKLDVNGSLAFTGISNLITGDFSNATLADRVMFKTSTLDGITALSCIPNGTGVESYNILYNATNPNNSSSLLTGITSTETIINSFKTGTGTYLPMTFYTSGSEKIRIATSGNVGIGTNNPESILNIKSNSSGGGIFLDRSGISAVTKIQFRNEAGANGSSILDIGTSNAMAFETGGSVERMRIDASGNVGIGITNPTAHLNISAGTATASTAPIKLTSGTNLTAPEAGAFEYDGTMPYFTSSTTSGRGYLPSIQVFGLSANGAAIGPAISNFFGANSAVNLAGGSEYEVEAYCYFTKTTAGTVTVTATTSLAPAILNGTVDYGAATGGTATGAANRISLFASTATNAAFGASASLTTAVNHCFRIRLVLSSNASASNIRINFTSSAGTVTPLRESYYKVTRLPSANVGSFAA